MRPAISLGLLARTDQIGPLRSIVGDAGGENCGRQMDFSFDALLGGCVR